MGSGKEVVASFVANFYDVKMGKMTRDELVEKLRELKRKELADERFRGHEEADEMLIEYIGDVEVKGLFESLERWYD